MSLADLRRERLREDAEYERRRQDERQRRRYTPDPVTVRPLPATLEEYLGGGTEACPEGWCKWPHEDTLEPTASLNVPQRLYLRERTCFRRGPDGRRRFGCDAVGKGRRSRFTSLGLGAIQFEIMTEMERFGQALACLTSLQAGTDDVLGPTHAQFGSALERLDEPYRSRWDSRGHAWIYCGRGIWQLITAGNSATVANRKGRSARWDIWQAADVGLYPHAEALWGAVWPTIPKQTGSILLEGTFPGDPLHFWQRRWRASHERKDPQILKAFFFPWYLDTSRRIPRDHPGFETAMRVPVEDAELEREALLALDPEQLAFRRQVRCGGTRDQRRAAKREYPENPEETTERPDETWLHPKVVEAVEDCAANSTPSARHRFGGVLGLVWLPESPARHVVGTVDTYEFGRDLQGCILGDRDTGDQLGQCHGQGLYSELARSVAWCLVQLGCGTITDPESLDNERGYRWHHDRYTLVVENNRGRGLGRELEKLGLRLWVQPPRPGQKQNATKWGVSTQAGNRPQFFDAIAAALEGPGTDEYGDPRDPQPTCKVRGTVLAHQLGQLVVKDGRVQPARGHDDLAMPYGMFHWVRPQLKPKPSLSEQWAKLGKSPPSTGSTLGPPI